MQSLKKSAIYLLAVTALLALPSIVGGCASVKPVLASIDEIAQTLCAKHHQETMGLSLEDAAEFYCKTREAYGPWIDAALASVQAGARASATANANQCPEIAPSSPAPTVAPVLVPSAPSGG